jgi:hypothetical protein
LRSQRLLFLFDRKKRRRKQGMESASFERAYRSSIASRSESTTAGLLAAAAGAFEAFEVAEAPFEEALGAEEGADAGCAGEGPSTERRISSLAVSV